MTKKNKDLSCPLDYAFQFISGKYKGRIIWYIYDANNVMRYGELKKILQNITPKMLTQSLRELESDRLIKRKVYRQVPPKVEYSLTNSGKELIPFLINLKEWGDRKRALELDNA